MSLLCCSQTAGRRRARRYPAHLRPRAPPLPLDGAAHLAIDCDQSDGVAGTATLTDMSRVELLQQQELLPLPTSQGVCKPWCVSSPCSDLNGDDLTGECNGCGPDAKCHPGAPGYIKEGQKIQPSSPRPPQAATDSVHNSGDPAQNPGAPSNNGARNVNDENEMNARNARVPSNPIGAELVFAICLQLSASPRGLEGLALDRSLLASCEVSARKVDDEHSLLRTATDLASSNFPAKQWLFIKLLSWFSPKYGLRAGSIFQMMITAIRKLGEAPGIALAASEGMFSVLSGTSQTDVLISLIASSSPRARRSHATRRCRRHPACRWASSSGPGAAARRTAERRLNSGDAGTRTVLAALSFMRTRWWTTRSRS